MKSATVDVLMPTYESNPDFLKEAIESVLQQSFDDWRLFIHDDCSKADVQAMVAPYLSDPRITFERSPVRLGIGGNWNACVQKTSSPYVQFLFQDDLWEGNLLAESIVAMERNPECSFLAQEHPYIFTDNLPTRGIYEELEKLRKEILKPGKQQGKTFLRWWMKEGLHPNVIGEPSFVMLRRSALQKTGSFDEAMPQFLDSEYWMRLLLNYDWYFLAGNLGQFRVHAAAASAQNQAEGKGLFDRLACFERLLTMLPPGPDRLLAEEALSSAFGKMVKKFFARKNSGAKVQTSGSGAVIRLALRHPMLLLKGVIRSVRT